MPVGLVVGVGRTSRPIRDDQEVALSIAALVLLDEAKEDVGMFLRLLRQAAALEASLPVGASQPQLAIFDVHPSGVVPLVGRRGALERVGCLLRVEHWGWNLASGDTDWSFKFDRRIRRLSEVETVEDYWSETHPAPERVQPRVPSAVFDSLGPLDPAYGTEPLAVPKWAELLHPSIAAVAIPRLRVGHGDNAVEEAWKVVAELLRCVSGLEGDGVSLVNHALGNKGPVQLADRSTDRGRDEHDGYADLLRGLVRVGRNLRAHRPSDPDVDENEVAIFLVLASHLLRRLELAEPTIGTSAS